MSRPTLDDVEKAIKWYRGVQEDKAYLPHDRRIAHEKMAVREDVVAAVLAELDASTLDQSELVPKFSRSASVCGRWSRKGVGSDGR